MWETKCHELRSMTHHQSIKKIKSHKPAGKAFCPMTLACFPLLLQQFHSPGSYATSFASCWLDLCSQLRFPLPNQFSNKCTLQVGHLSLSCFKRFLQESTTIILRRTWALKLKEKKKKKKKKAQISFIKKIQILCQETRFNLKHLGHQKQ